MAALERVGLDLVPAILDVLKSDVPGALVPCQMLEMYVLCKRAVPGLDVRLFTPGGQVDAYGTFLLHIPEHRGYVIFHTTDPDTDLLKLRIRRLPDIDWTDLPTLGPIHDRFDAMVQQIMEEEKLRLEAEPNPADNLAMTRQQALDLDIILADDLELRPITVDQAQYINDRWPHRGPKTPKFIEDNIRTKGGIALYKKGSTEMLSWALFSLVGGVGMMQTAEAHRRKGYGEAVARALTKAVAEHGFEPQVQIKHGITNSRRMFECIGYTFTHVVHWYTVNRRPE